ncbi:MAG: glycoside hydrolase family 127 protein [Gemmataceae bacterium]
MSTCHLTAPGMARLLVGLLVVPGVLAAADGTDRWSPVPIRAVKVGGEIGRRIDVTVKNNLLALDADRDFLAPFAAKKGCAGGYIGLGKVIDAAATLAAYTGDPKVVALKDRLVQHTLRHQEADGYLGLFPPAERMTALWDVHEVQYLVWGLLRDHEHFGGKESLTGARKAADYLIAHWDKLPADWGRGGVAANVAVTGLERTMVALYRVTGDRKYLDFVCRIRKLPEWDLPIVIGRRAGIEGHMYAYLARTLAQLELYRATRDERLLRPARRATAFMLDGDGLMLTGSGGQWEIWTADQDGRGALGETCATAYQMRVYDAMLRHKGDAVWGDVMERTVFNTLFAAQSPDGRRLRYFAPTEGPREYHPTDTYCCPCNYRRIVAELPTFVYYRTPDGVAVNLYTASTADIELASGSKVKLEQVTDYPSSGKVTLRLTPARPTRFALQLRIPAWSTGTRVAVNGRPIDGAITAGRFLPIEREWQAGDTVTIDMPMPFRLVTGRQRQAGRVAVMRGPLVFTLNPVQRADLKGVDAVELSRLILDPATLKAVPDDTVRPGGVAVKVKGWKASFGMATPPHEFELTLREFADPNGKQTYFSLSDPAPAVADELFRSRAGSTR